MENKIKFDLSPLQTSDLYLQLNDSNDFDSKKEAILNELTKRAILAQNTSELSSLIDFIKVRFGASKISLAKQLKIFLDIVTFHDNSNRSIELEISTQIHDWASRESKNFLKTKLTVRIAEIHCFKGQSRKAKEMIDPIISEAQLTDDKALLIEGQLLEAKIYCNWQDWAKAKASLSSCRAVGSKIYLSPLLQADIDSVSGIIHLAQKDYPIACSYFTESLEGFNQQNDKARAAKVFRYLLVSKILIDNVADAQAFVDGKYGLMFSRFDNVSLTVLDIFNAYKQKNLVLLSDSLVNKGEVLKIDPVIFSTLESLYSQLLEKNILKLVRPYSCIQIAHLSFKLQISDDLVEKKLCEMILDQKLRAFIDQDKAVLILLPTEKKNEIFKSALEIVNNMDSVIDVLFQRAAKIEITN